MTKSDRKEYEKEMENFYSLPPGMRLGKEKPGEPKHRMFFIPANSSSSAFIQALSENDFTGVIFETEADTLANTFKQKWGNFSDVLRKAFHHESATLFRRKDNEFIDVRNPHIAIALSGTPRQVHRMMPDTENGLFSRFLYYAFEDNGPFKNPFISYKDINYIQFFEEKGRQTSQKSVPGPSFYHVRDQTETHLAASFRKFFPGTHVEINRYRGTSGYVFDKMAEKVIHVIINGRVVPENNYRIVFFFQILEHFKKVLGRFAGKQLFFITNRTGGIIQVSGKDFSRLPGPVGRTRDEKTGCNLLFG